jgi:hypothetical protein
MGMEEIANKQSELHAMYYNLRKSMLGTSKIDGKHWENTTTNSRFESPRKDLSATVSHVQVVADVAWRPKRKVTSNVCKDR